MMSTEVACSVATNGGLDGVGNEDLVANEVGGNEIGAPAKVLSKVVWVRTKEGGVQAIPQEVAFLSPFIQREAIHAGSGWKSDSPVDLPKQLNPETLGMIVEYCQFHRAQGRSDKERKLFDEKFIRMDACRLCQLTSAADALDLRPLVDLASRALARLISGKTPEEIRSTFNLPDDLTEEEKLEPVPFGTDEPRIRLLNRLYAKKRRELAERKARKEMGTVDRRDTVPPIEDTRSVDELVSFIESGAAVGGTGAGTPRPCQSQAQSGNCGSGGRTPQSKKSSKRKKNSKRRDRKRETSSSLDASASGGLESERQSVDTSEVSNTSMDRSSPGRLDDLDPSDQADVQGLRNGTLNNRHLSVSVQFGPAPIRKVFQIPDCPVEELFPEEGFEGNDPELESEVANFARRLESDLSIWLQEQTDR